MPDPKLLLEACPSILGALAKAVRKGDHRRIEVLEELVDRLRAMAEHLRRREVPREEGTDFAQLLFDLQTAHANPVRDLWHEEFGRVLEPLGRLQSDLMMADYFIDGAWRGPPPAPATEATPTHLKITEPNRFIDDLVADLERTIAKANTLIRRLGGRPRHPMPMG